jgi:MFS family permease
MVTISPLPTGIPSMLLGYFFRFFLDGIAGPDILAIAMVNTYSTDCVPAHRCSTAFGYFHASTCIGIALGPILAGYLVEWSGRIVTLFWIMLGVHVCCALFVLLFVPSPSLGVVGKRRTRRQHWPRHLV